MLVSMYNEHACLLDAHTVQVGSETVAARYILVALAIGEYAEDSRY